MLFVKKESNVISYELFCSRLSQIHLLLHFFHICTAIKLKKKQVIGLKERKKDTPSKKKSTVTQYPF